jgi:hypothetical protein
LIFRRALAERRRRPHASSSEEHSALAAEVLGALRDATSAGPCRVHTSDLRIYGEAPGLATFPDGSVLCGPLEQHGPSPIATALNPTVLVEFIRGIVPPWTDREGFWQLTVVPYRVFYDVDEQRRIVDVRAVRRKLRQRTEDAL